MATMKAILFLAVVCGAMSLASAGDGSVASSRKMLFFRSNGVASANANARCANGFFFRAGFGCVAFTRTDSSATPFSANAESDSVSFTPFGGVGVGTARASAFGRNSRARTNTNSFSSRFGASSSSNSFASAGGK